MKLTDKQLQLALSRLAKASTEGAKQRAIIDGHCEAVYGVDTGDADNDEFIDACAGGCGYCSGMTPREFHESMVFAIAKRQ